MTTRIKNVLLAALAAAVGAGGIAFLTLPAGAAITATVGLSIGYAALRAFVSVVVEAVTGAPPSIDKN